jgi:hypothetical protein
MPEAPPVTTARLPSKSPTSPRSYDRKDRSGGSFSMAMETRRVAMRINASLALVVVSLIAELLLVVLLTYGAYRIFSH